MKLVNCEGGIYRMTKRNLRAYLCAIRSGESPNIDRFGSCLGLAVNVTDMGAVEASVELEVLDGEARRVRTRRMTDKRLIRVHAGLYRTRTGATSIMRWTFGPKGVGPWVVRWRSMIGGQQQERSFDSFGEAKSFVLEGGVPEKNLRTR